MLKNILRVLALLALTCLPAYAQSVPPGFNYGDVPTAGQWASAWSSKNDVLGYVPLNSAGGNMSGRLGITPSTTGTAGINVAPGVAPTSPTDGDLWTTTAGVFAQINGVTTGPFGAAGANQTITPGTGLISSPSPCTTSSCAISLSTPVSVANGGTNCTTLTCLATAMGLGTLSTQNANAIAATGGTIDGTAIGGTTKAAGAFTTLSATTPMGVPSGGSGAGTFTANAPLLGNGTSAFAVGSRSGNTTVFASSTGSLTSGHCVDLDGNGNYVDSGGACGVPALSGDTTIYIRTVPATVTMTIASPAVVTWTAHGLSNHSPVVFSTTGALPTGVVAGQIYFVIATGLTANAFEFSATDGGSAVNTSGSQSGTQTGQTGNDANDCSANSIAHACLTAQHGLDLMQSVDANDHQFVVQLADGDYNENLRITGTRSPIETNGVDALPELKGNVGTPSNVRLNAATSCFTATAATSQIGLDGITFNSGIIGVLAGSYATIQLYNVAFGAGLTAEDIGAVGGTVTLNDPYSIAGNPLDHWFAIDQGVIDASQLSGETITLIGTPAFGTAFAVALDLALINTPSDITFSGPATGDYYFADLNSVIDTSGGGPTYLPGSTPGVTATGGQYN